MMGKVRRSIARYLAASLLVCAPTLWAQAAKYAGQPIAEIQFVPPDQPLTAAELNDAVTLKKGTPLRLSDVHTVIENLYATGDYEDIQVEADSFPSSGVTRAHRHQE